PRFYIGSHHRVDEAVVEFEPLAVYRPSALGQDARPGGRQAIGADAELAHQRHILGPAMIMVARDITGVVAENRPGQTGEGVPDRRPPAVLPHRALDLIGRRRGAP